MTTFSVKKAEHVIRHRLSRTRAEARVCWHEMIASEAPARILALAFAVGTLVSTIPVPLVDMALAAYILRRYGRLPRAPFVAAMAITNNLVMAPIYASTPKVGGFVIHWLGKHTPVSAPDALPVQILVGYLIVAAGLALGSFLVAHTGFYGYQTVRRAEETVWDTRPELN